jgi:hypothetical protein
LRLINVALAVSRLAVCQYAQHASNSDAAGHAKLSVHESKRFRKSRAIAGATKPGMFAHVFARDDSNVVSAPPTSRYVATYPEACTETVAEAMQCHAVAALTELARAKPTTCHRTFSPSFFH